MNFVCSELTYTLASHFRRNLDMLLNLALLHTVIESIRDTFLFHQGRSWLRSVCAGLVFVFI